MVFINAAVDPSILPAVEALEMRPTHPDYKKVVLFRWGIAWVVMLTAAAGAGLWWILSGSGGRWFIPIGILALGMGFGAWASLHSLRWRGYALREHDVAVQRGWLVQHLQVVPLRRVQNASVSSGPIERIWGLATLTVYTAGDDEADITLPGLARSEAERLSAFILDYSKPTYA